jgi:hypothetical protein
MEGRAEDSMRAEQGNSTGSVRRKPILTSEYLLAAPALQRTVESIERLIPGIRVWFLPKGKQRVPIVAGSEAHCADFAELSSADRARILTSDVVPPETPGEGIPLVRECCPGRYRALAPLRFGSEDLGLVGVCGLDGERVKHAARIVTGNLRLLINILEDHDDLELIHRVWGEMGSVSEPPLLLLGCLDRVLAATGVATGAIFLFDADGRAKLHGQRGLREEKAQRVSADFALSDLEDLIEGKGVTSIAIPPGHALWDWVIAVTSDREAPAHLYVVPFFHGEEVLGFVLLLPPRSFSGEKERPALHVLLDGMGSAIHNVLTLAGERSRSRALSTIHAIHRLVSVAESREDFLKRLSNLMADVFEVEKCGFMLWDPAVNQLVPAGSVGLEEGEIGRHAVAVGEGLIGRAAESYEAQRFIRSRAADSETPWGAEYKAGSYLSVPLVEEDLVAVMTLGSAKKEFSIADQQMAFVLGEQVVIALRLVQLPREGDQ